MKLLVSIVITFIMAMGISAAPRAITDPAPLGGECGTIVGIQCEEGLYCQLEDKNVADSAGTCIKKY
ncbi:unnamed protein product [Rhizoctonia solani]|uniref:Uncharacterized protein n=1 Tax=Rhizoctonia solani TaxID=456999 RepID=A0A8H3C1P7_9AGAM|nr:unnamed protein product [Rhizoctonia solani]